MYSIHRFLSSLLSSSLSSIIVFRFAKEFLWTWWSCEGRGRWKENCCDISYETFNSLSSTNVQIYLWSAFSPLLPFPRSLILIASQYEFISIVHLWQLNEPTITATHIRPDTRRNQQQHRNSHTEICSVSFWCWSFLFSCCSCYSIRNCYLYLWVCERCERIFYGTFTLTYI